MLQRQQTIWLILATGAAILSFIFPFAVGTVVEKAEPMRAVVDAGSDFFLLILTGASIILSSIIIFFYKNRPLQLKLCFLGLIIAALLIIIYIIETKKLSSIILALSCVLPFITLAGYMLAMRNIRKDEKLVRSLDKLR